MTALKVLIEPLEEKDVNEIMAIERTAFLNHWPESAFINELQKNQLAHYIVARHDGMLVGYAGLWIVIDEAHITTVAVHPDYRRKKIAEQLVHQLLSMAVAKEARWATLEVRESNEAAQTLYKKFGFAPAGIRKNYYMEENENAVIMWAGNLRGEHFKEKLIEIGEALEKEVSRTS